MAALNAAIRAGAVKRGLVDEAESQAFEIERVARIVEKAPSGSNETASAASHSRSNADTVVFNSDDSGKCRDDESVSTRKRVEIALGAGDRILLTRPHPGLDLPRSGFGTVVSVSETLLYAHIFSRTRN